MFDAQNMIHPDGLIIIDDMITCGALVAMQKLDIHPLHEVQIVSHTNRGSAVLQGHEHQLIIMEIDPTKIVETMFEMLNPLMNEKELAIPTVQVKAHLHSSQHLHDF